MNEDINTYTVKLKKIDEAIDITIIKDKYEHNKYEYIVDYCYALFNPHVNKYYISEPLTKFAVEVLLYNKLIEQIDLEFCPKFTLTNTALFSLL